MARALQLVSDISSGELAEITASNKRSLVQKAGHHRGGFFQSDSV